ncbi:MAG: hypothetical protein ACI87Q_003091 [Pseudohongiellaceae bacterium]|jgi:hypothetical protein
MQNTRDHNYSAALKPAHIVAGLGEADRQLIATCLALFDDSAFLRQMTKLYNHSLSKVGTKVGKNFDAASAEVRSRFNYWMYPESGTDDQLKAILWITIREAFELPPRLSGTEMGAARLSDDLAAAMIHLLSPPRSLIDAGKGFVKPHIEKAIAQSDLTWFKDFFSAAAPAITFREVVEPVLEELLANVVTENNNPEVQGEILSEVVDVMAGLSEADQESLRIRLGVDELNKTAAKKMLLTAGGLASISGSVSMAGFSAYILAAQASVFIPLVSGPGLVSFLSVVSNPVTMIGGTIAAAWWFSNSTAQKVKVSVATRVVAMLAIQGLDAGTRGVNKALKCFSSIKELPGSCGIEASILDAYKKERSVLSEIFDSPRSPDDPHYWKLMDKPVILESSKNKTSSQEIHNTAALSTMTVGEMLYAYFTVDPLVTEAADFSYLESIDGPVDLALIIDGFSPRAIIRLKGYVAEHAVAAHLSAQGNAVSFPDASNEPGWDLLVDGEKIQVKFQQTIYGIKEHFESYDYKVIANSELIGKIPAEFVDRVYFIDGLSNEVVSQLTQESISAAETLANPDIAPMAMLVTLYRSGKGFLAQELSALQAVEQVFLDGSVRVGLVGAGSLAGSGLGMLIFGPAGAWVFSAGMPVLLQGQTGRVVSIIQERLMLADKQWKENIHQELDRFHENLRKTCKSKLELFAKQHIKTGKDAFGSYMKWKIEDQCRYVQETSALLELVSRHEYPLPEGRFKETLRWLAASGIHPVCYQQNMKNVIQILKDRPTMGETILTEDRKAQIAQGSTRAGELISSATKNTKDKFIKLIKKRKNI